MRAIPAMVFALAALTGAAWLCPADRGRAALEPGCAAAAAAPSPGPAPLECADAGAAGPSRACVRVRAARPSPALLAQAAARALTEVQDGPGRELEARARAAQLDLEGQQELARIAGNARSEVHERLAAAELLRHVPGASLPPAALALLRGSWAARETDARLAAAAARALGRFGDAQDRRALLDASAASSGIALAGLSAARGDAAALELAAVARDETDARRSEIALAALATIAAAQDGALSPGARSECAAALERAFSDGREARRLCALALLDPQRSAAR
jgi:hypothetical protein